MRTLILAATHPRAAERTGDVGAFLEGLTAAELALTEPDTEQALDPLEARPGDLLDGRFRLQGRLGAGSTAVGLLVTDESARNVRRVLKVALDDRAATRLQAEADVLGQLPRTPRIVQLIEPPLVIGGRVALLLSFAGAQTLGERLSERQRLSLDLLQRWGDDLLEALDALDRAGLDHRDIKPANLGVHQSPPDRLDHLVLFDFSASRAPASDLETGTVPYLDPFLGSGRNRFDAAAERYAAAVVLFEMATGSTPVYGADSSAHPGSVPDEVTLTRELFDPTVADGFAASFTSPAQMNVSPRHFPVGCRHVSAASSTSTRGESTANSPTAIAHLRTCGNYRERTIGPARAAFVGSPACWTPLDPSTTGCRG